MATLPVEKPVAAVPEPVRGLTEAQVLERRRQGQGNDIKLRTSRSYTEIFRTNILNAINIVLFSIGAVMIMIGRIGDAVTSVGLIAMNVVIGIVQEIRAKRQLDNIALLTRPKVSVIREGQEKIVDPAELVLGDIVVMKAGDQNVVDGVVVGDGVAQVDESLLTGETDLIEKRAGAEILSGSFCVSGQLVYEATRVGANSFANKLTANAREFQVAFTPLQLEINFILRLLILLAAYIGFLMVIASVFAGVPLVRQVQIAAVVAGLIPNGLFFMVILAYALGAVRIVSQGALVQQTNAVESLSNVTVLCTDKTGTLTANAIFYNDVFPVGEQDREALKRALADFAASASATNKTSEALLEGLPGKKRITVDEVPFSSAWKWSALSFDDESLRGAYVMGAMEMIEAQLTNLTPEVTAQLNQWSDEGLRVLAFARNSHTRTFDRDEKGVPSLPQLELIGLISFGDVLRPQLKETLNGFFSNNIAVKVISGDNPHTVAALARQAGFQGDLRYVSGTELDVLSDSELEEVAATSTVFGRITPQQKERLVTALQARGHYVAMIGDGVNDVLSLKKANMGIAMQSGSAATRAVADMILLNDSFAALPSAFTEGQRIINGMKDIMRLFLTRVFYSALIILGVAVIGLGFPFIPKHTALHTFLTVGFPVLGLALWARPGRLPKHGMLKEIAHFVIPAGVLISVFGLVVYSVIFIAGLMEMVQVDISPEDIATFQEFAGINYDIPGRDQYILEVSHLTAQTALTAFSVFVGLLLVVFVEPPVHYFVGGDEFSGDWRPTIIAAVMFVAYWVIVFVEPFRKFFELSTLPPMAYFFISVMTLLWMVLQRRAWRSRWLQRFLQIDLPS